MAYARCGDDSDVYVIRHLNCNFIVWFALGKPNVVKLMEENKIADEITFNNQEDTLAFLLVLRDLGFMIPQHAIERMKYELGLENTFEEYLRKGY